MKCWKSRCGNEKKFYFSGVTGHVAPQNPTLDTGCLQLRSAELRVASFAQQWNTPSKAGLW